MTRSVLPCGDIVPGNRVGATVDATGQTLVVLLIAAAALLALWRRRGLVRGSTLVSVWWWHAVAVIATAAAAGGAWVSSGAAVFDGARPDRYLACTAMMCPLMALLGAKRPQSRAWFPIVAALWIVLAMPAISVMAYARGREVAIDPVRSAFLVVLLLVGLVNWLPTRAAAAHVLQGLGHLAMLSPYLPRDPFPEGWMVGLMGFAAYAAGLVLWTPLTSKGPTTSRPLNRAWLDFRDAYGLVWGVRVLERFNSEGARHGWRIRLGWVGLRSIVPGGGAELSPETDQRMRKLMRTLLRRFVSRSWLEARLPGG